MTLALRLAAAAFVAAVVAAPAAAGTKPTVVSGVVVAREQARGTLVVAGAHGLVQTVRTHAKARVGAHVRATATKLSDGTFRAAKVTTSGRAATARIRGVVVSVLPTKLLLSAGGSVFAIGRARTTAAVGAHAGDVQPGDVVSAVVSIDPKSEDVQESDVQTVGTAALVELEGTISSLGSGSLVLAVERGAVTTLQIPASLTLPTSIAVGDQVEVLAQFASGAFTLVTIQDDHAAASSGSGTSLSGEDHAKVEAEGIVAAVSPTSLSVQPEHGSPVVFAVPSGLDVSGVQVGDRVHAKGAVQPDGSLLLARLEAQGGKGGEHHGDANTVKAEGTVTAVGSGSLAVQGEHGDTVTFVVPAGFDLSGVAVGDTVDAKGTKNADGTVTLVSVETQHDAGGASGSGSGGDSGSGG